MLPNKTNQNVFLKIQGFIHKSKFELLPYAPYSPNLAPSDYFPFLNLKKYLCGQLFSINEEMENSVNGNFEKIDGFSFKQGIKALEWRWKKKCKLLKKDNVEK